MNCILATQILGFLNQIEEVLLERDGSQPWKRLCQVGKTPWVGRAVSIQSKRTSRGEPSLHT